MDSKFNQLEMAKIFGEPRDPRRKYPLLVSNICETDTAEVDEYHYYFDAIEDTDTIYTITATGAVTQAAVTPDTPAALTFVDAVTPEYYFKLTDLASAKERVIARKLQTINRALNAYENYQIINVMETACVSNSQTMTVTSSGVRFKYDDAVTLIDNIIDYGDSFTLVASSTIDKDIKLWDWNDNKYTSLSAALKDLEIEIVRIKQTVTIDTSSTAVIPAAMCYMVAKDTEMGKPLIFVRKKLNSIDLLGGTMKTADGDAPERLVFVSPNPITVTSTARYLAVGVTGFEEIAVATKNYRGFYQFTRAAGS